MLDNWTSDQLFDCIRKNGIENVCREIGRVAINDNTDLEKSWDKYVQSRTEVLNNYNTWFHQGLTY